MKVFCSIGIAILLLSGLQSCASEQRTLSRQDSPNQKLAAFLIESLAGSEGTVHQDVYIHEQALPPDLGKPVFSGTGCDHLSIVWLNDYTLQIHYETTCAIDHFTNRWFRPSDLAVGRPNPVEVILIRG